MIPKLLVFLTFFGSCLVIGLLLSALVSSKWVVAEEITLLKHKSGSAGKINFGLFTYEKTFNHGYGERNHDPMSVAEIIKSESGFMDYWLWLLTAMGVGLALFASAVSAVSSVVSTIRKSGGMTLMIVSNACAAVAQAIAFICWIIQFYKHLVSHFLAFIN